MLHQKKRILQKQQHRTLRPFDLQRTFALLSLVCIAAISAVSAVVLTRFLSAQLLKRDAVVSMEVIQAVANTEDLELLLGKPDFAAYPHAIPEFFTHVASMPDVFRVAIYTPDRTIAWSSDPKVIGMRFHDNDDLERALGGELVFELSDRLQKFKDEYQFIRNGETTFVETYIPVWDSKLDEILGIVEIYKIPRAVFDGMAAGERLIWTTSAAGAVFLYLTLFWIVRRATIAMRGQQERLIEAETMAAVGEMASGIAHGIRNPLSSIRTSAELALEEPSEEASNSQEAARDVIAEVDRLERIIRELILMARNEREDLRPLCVAELAKCCISGLTPAIERQGVSVSMDIDGPLSRILGDRPVLHLALNNVISNALEAMPKGGTLAIATRMVDDGESVELTITDTGHGIPEDRVDQVFKPFVTSKSSGLGLGLALTRRIVERHGGMIALTSKQGQGTTVTICLPAGAE